MTSYGLFEPSNFAITLLEVDFRKVLRMPTDGVTFNGIALNPGFLASSITSGDMPANWKSFFDVSLEIHPSNSANEAPSSSDTNSSWGPDHPDRTTFQP